MGKYVQLQSNYYSTNNSKQPRASYSNTQSHSTTSRTYSKTKTKTKSKIKTKGKIYRHDKNLIKSIFNTPKSKDIVNYNYNNNDKYHTKRKKKVNIRMPTSKKPRGSTSVKITSNGPIKLFHDNKEEK